MRQYLMLLLALSGCAGPAVDSCAEASCDLPEDSLPTAVVLPGLAFEKCRGVFAGLYVPASQVRVPSAFQLDNPLHVHVDSLHCERVVLPGSVHQNVGLLWLSVEVSPHNKSWDDPAYVSHYGLAVLSTNETVSGALQAAGATVEDAVLELAPIDLVGAHAEAWQFATSNATYQLHWPGAEGTEAARPTLYRHIWFGAGPYNRVDIQESDAYGARPWRDAAGSFRIEGASAFHEAMGADAASIVGQTLADSRWSIAAEPKHFEGPK